MILRLWIAPDAPARTAATAPRPDIVPGPRPDPTRSRPADPPTRPALRRVAATCSLTLPSGATPRQVAP